MTPDALRKATSSKQGPLAYAGALCALDEQSRKKLSKTAQDLYREARKEERAEWGQATHQGSLARLAILACCPWSQAKRVHGRSWQLPGKSDHWSLAVIKILTERRPDWSSDWINLQLEDAESAWACVLTWLQIRQLAGAGVIERPTADGYVHLMTGIPPAKYEQLIDDEFLEHDLWRLFEVQTFAFHGLRPVKEIDRRAWAARIHDPVQRVDDHWVGGGGWSRVVYHLAATGKISRTRLFDALLAAFWRDFNSPTFAAFIRLHDLLEPTDNDIAGREATYRELLRCDYGPAVSMALKALGKLQKAKKMDVAEFLASVGEVFSIASKSQPSATLTLIDRVCQNAGQHRAAAVSAVAPALNHVSADVQEKGIAMLAKWKAADSSLDLSTVLTSATMLAPQHRTTLAALVAGVSMDQVSTDDRSCTPPMADLEQRADAVQERIGALPSWAKEICDLGPLADALATCDSPPPFDPPPDFPVLSGVDPIPPIQDVDELIDVAAQVIAHTAAPEETERMIDAIFRLGKDRPENFEPKTEGLRTAIETNLYHPFTQLSNTPNWQPHAVQVIVGHWLEIDAVKRLLQPSAKTGFDAIASFLKSFAVPDFGQLSRQISEAIFAQLSPLDWKFSELAQRIHREEYGPVLSTPTHQSGWIDPRVFVDRLRTLGELGIEIGQRDYIGGILRLAPEFRQQALDDAVDLNHPHGRILRYALGGDERPTGKERDIANLWLAAGRARHPRGQLDDLDVLKLSHEEPDGITPASYSFNPDADPTDMKYMRFGRGSNSGLGVAVTPGKPAAEYRESRPSVALAARVLSANPAYSITQDAQNYQLSSITPANTDAALAFAANQLLVRIDDKGSAWEPVSGLMSSMLDVDRGWSDIARIALWIGIVSRDDQARGTAIDALIDGIGDGRADSAALTTSLLEVASGGWMKLNRLAQSLREVARTSVLAERTVATILDGLIGSWEKLPRDGHHVLDLQLQLVSSSHWGMSDASRQWLGSVKGSGKAAKLAKQLCAVKSDADSSLCRLAALDAAEGRLARAERIARYYRQSGGAVRWADDSKPMDTSPNR